MTCTNCKKIKFNIISEAVSLNEQETTYSDPKTGKVVLKDSTEYKPEDFNGAYEKAQQLTLDLIKKKQATSDLIVDLLLNSINEDKSAAQKTILDFLQNKKIVTSQEFNTIYKQSKKSGNTGKIYQALELRAVMSGVTSVVEYMPIYGSQIAVKMMADILSDIENNKGPQNENKIRLKIKASKLLKEYDIGPVVGMDDEGFAEWALSGKRYRMSGKTAIGISLDVGGIIDPFGVVDTVGMVFYLNERDFMGAAFSAIGIVVPYAADAVSKTIKYGLKIAGKGGGAILASDAIAGLVIKNSDVIIPKLKSLQDNKFLNESGKATIKELIDAIEGGLETLKALLKNPKGVDEYVTKKQAIANYFRQKKQAAFTVGNITTQASVYLGLMALAQAYPKEIQEAIYNAFGFITKNLVTLVGTGRYEEARATLLKSDYYKSACCSEDGVEKSNCREVMCDKKKGMLDFMDEVDKRAGDVVKQLSDLPIVKKCPSGTTKGNDGLCIDKENNVKAIILPPLTGEPLREDKSKELTEAITLKFKRARGSVLRKLGDALKTNFRPLKSDIAEFTRLVDDIAKRAGGERAGGALEGDFGFIPVARQLTKVVEGLENHRALIIKETKGALQRVSDTYDSVRRRPGADEFLKAAQFEQRQILKEAAERLEEVTKQQEQVYNKLKALNNQVPDGPKTPTMAQSLTEIEEQAKKLHKALKDNDNTALEFNYTSQGQRVVKKLEDGYRIPVEGQGPPQIAAEWKKMKERLEKVRKDIKAAKKLPKKHLEKIVGYTPKTPDPRPGIPPRLSRAAAELSGPTGRLGKGLIARRQIPYLRTHISVLEAAIKTFGTAAACTTIGYVDTIIAAADTTYSTIFRSAPAGLYIGNRIVKLVALKKYLTTDGPNLKRMVKNLPKIIYYYEICHTGFFSGVELATTMAVGKDVQAGWQKMHATTLANRALSKNEDKIKDLKKKRELIERRFEQLVKKLGPTYRFQTTNGIPSNKYRVGQYKNFLNSLVKDGIIKQKSLDSAVKSFGREFKQIEDVFNNTEIKYDEFKDYREFPLFGRGLGAALTAPTRVATDYLKDWGVMEDDRSDVRRELTGFVSFRNLLELVEKAQTTLKAPDPVAAAKELMPKKVPTKLAILRSPLNDMLESAKSNVNLVKYIMAKFKKCKKDVMTGVENSVAQSKMNSKKIADIKAYFNLKPVDANLNTQDYYNALKKQNQQIIDAAQAVFMHLGLSCKVLEFFKLLDSGEGSGIQLLKRELEGENIFDVLKSGAGAVIKSLAEEYEVKIVPFSASTNKDEHLDLSYLESVCAYYKQIAQSIEKCALEDTPAKALPSTATQTGDEKSEAEK